MDKTYLDSWKNSLSNGFNASKGYLANNIPSSPSALNVWFKTANDKIGNTMEAVKESGYLNSLDTDKFKGWVGYGYDKTKGIITGSLVMNRDDLESLKTTAVSSYDATKGFLLGTLVLSEESTETAKRFFKGTNMFNALQGNKLIMKITNAGQVNILDKATRDWIVRLDKAHKGYEYTHLNIRTKFSGLKRDPHLKLPPGSLYVSNFQNIPLRFLLINHFEGRRSYRKSCENDQYNW